MPRLGPDNKLSGQNQPGSATFLSFLNVLFPKILLKKLLTTIDHSNLTIIIFRFFPAILMTLRKVLFIIEVKEGQNVR